MAPSSRTITRATGAILASLAVVAGTVAVPATAAPAAPVAPASGSGVDQRAALWDAAARDGALSFGAASSGAASSSGARSYAGVGPAYFVDDPDYFFYWREDDPAQDCFPNLYCEITQVDMFVPKVNSDSLVALTYLDRPTNPELPTSAYGGVAVYLDTQGDSDFEYATLAPKRYFGLTTYYDWFMYYWDGSDWVRMNVEATWYRDAYFWGAIMPWRTLGITAARLAVEVCDVNGQCDVAPNAGTPRIEIKGAVDGLPPNAPSSLTVTYSYKKTKAFAALTWIYQGPGGPNSILNYSYRVSGNGGKTWTPWKSTYGNRVTVTGLRKGQRGFFEVKAQNRSGYGPAARIALRP